MEQIEKNYHTLELDRVLEMLAKHTASDGARAAAENARPADSPAEVRRLLDQTGEAYRLLVLQGSPSFDGLRDVKGAIARADAGGTLSCRELLQVAGVLRCARGASAYFGGKQEPAPRLHELFSSLYANKYLEERIFNSILGDEEIADAASPALADIRRHMRIAGEKIRSGLQKILNSPTLQKALQEPIITMRDDRYVLPVKAECRSAVPGLVHDISASGATLFIEPMSAVQANNEIRELLAKEKREIERILAEFSALVSDAGEDVRLDVTVLTELDLIFARAKLAESLDCTRPEVTETRHLLLRKARHPLLDQKLAVPITLELGLDYDTLVITGPNTGGKTVSLKTAGLLCLMGQCGLFLPAAEGSVLPVPLKVLADIGDEQSIEQSLSTFSGHMTNIREILSACSGDTLVLFDELGAGTDPVEGAALAVSIIEYTRAAGALVMATTHYAELKSYAVSTRGVENGCCEFDVDSLRPTYRLLIGIPGKSNAFAISARLGLPQSVIDDAKGRIGNRDAAMEDVLGRVERMRRRMEEQELETAQALESARRQEETVRRLRIETEELRGKAAESAKREADRILRDARQTTEAVFAQLDRMRRANHGADTARMNDERAALRRQLNEAEDRAGANAMTRTQEDPGPSRPAEVGDEVILLSLGTHAQVIGIGRDGLLSLQAGSMKISASQQEVRVCAPTRTKQRPAAASPAVLREAVAPEVDLRGMLVQEAVDRMEKYIDSASTANLETVTVIHGKGTGALRAAVQQALRTNPEVKSFRAGKYGEGESGVTVVTLR